MSNVPIMRVRVWVLSKRFTINVSQYRNYKSAYQRYVYGNLHIQFLLHYLRSSYPTNPYTKIYILEVNTSRSLYARGLYTKTTYTSHISSSEMSVPISTMPANIKRLPNKPTNKFSHSRLQVHCYNINSCTLHQTSIP